MSNNKGLFEKDAINKVLVDGSNYTGAFGEITIDLTLPGLRLHDGNHCGGVITVVGTASESALATAQKIEATKSAEKAATAKVLNVEKVEK